jgi:hypothetical protein
LTFFDCDGVEFDKYRRLFFTYKKPDGDMQDGLIDRKRGNVYAFNDNGAFEVVYAPV